MNSLFTYMFLGLSLAAPVGPVNAAQLNTGIKNGFFHAWIFGIGALTADVLYMLMVYVGVAHVIELPFIKTLLWLFGCFVLMYTGIENLLTLQKIELDMRFGRNIPLRKSLFSGFFMSLLNPLTILFWLGIYGSILAETAQSSTQNQIVLHSLAVISGILVWDITMAFLSSGARRFLSTGVLKGISVVSSLSMIGFGIYFGMEAYKVLF